jgi:hypothetical protein
MPYDLADAQKSEDDMKFKTLSIIGALLISLAVPSFALAGDRGGRYHSAGSSKSYDRGGRYERGQPYRSSGYHGRSSYKSYHGDRHHHNGYYGHNHGYYGHKSRSSFSFSFGLGSYWPVYREPLYVNSYYYEPVYVRPAPVYAPVYVAPAVGYYSYNSCYSRPSSYYYAEARYHYGR